MKVIDKDTDDLKVLIDTKTLTERIKEIANTLDSNFKEDEEIYVICVLKGSVMFCAELVKYMKRKIQMEFIRISSYGNAQKSTNKLKAIDLTLPDLEGKNVVVIEDIVDTGLTAKYLIDLLTLEHRPKKLMFVSLLNKKCARKIDIEPDIYGFEVDDKFVVGFGLDYAGYLRNLPFIAYFP